MKNLCVYVFVLSLAGWVFLFGFHAGLSKCPEEKAWQTVEAEVTAYCICEKCCGKSLGHSNYGLTASGYQIHLGDHTKLVASSRDIPFGSWVKIPGYNENKPVQVLDRGGAITEGKFDVLFNDSREICRFQNKVMYVNHRDALIWGRQHLTIQVLKAAEK